MCLSVEIVCMFYCSRIFYCMGVEESVSPSVMSSSLQPQGLWPARLLCLWDFPGKNTGVGSHSLLQGIFLTQELNPDLLHCGKILNHLSHQESPVYIQEDTVCIQEALYVCRKILYGCDIIYIHSLLLTEIRFVWGY